MLRKENNIITDTKEIVQVLNDHLINIVERSCGEKATSVPWSYNSSLWRLSQCKT